MSGVIEAELTGLFHYSPALYSHVLGMGDLSNLLPSSVDPTDNAGLLPALIAQ